MEGGRRPRNCEEERGATPMNAKHTAIATLIGVIILVLAACGGTGTTSADPLDGTAWELTAYGTSEPIPGTTITATFEEGQMRGSAGCNTYSGSYQVDGEFINVGQLAMTEMACLQPEGVMDQELMYLEFLRGARIFELGDGGLRIFRSDGEALTFVPQE
jgi:heat shock protein HslJ